VRVAIWLENCPEWVEAALAARHRGALVIAVNTRFRAREVQDILRRSEATAIVVSPKLRDELAQVDAPALEHVLAPGELSADGPDRSDPDAPWLVFTSSGTTGAPKLVVHTQGGMDAHAAAVADAFGYRAPDAVVLCMLPLCGVFGFCTLAGAQAAGCPYVLLDEFDAERASDLIRAHRVTHTTGSDEMIRRLLEHPTGTLREAGFAAFNLEPRPLVDAADARGIALYQCYGASEMQALVAHAPRDAPPERRAVAGGRPVSAAITVRVRDEEIQVRGPNVMAGYLGDEAATREAFTDDGFYRSGDLGRETDDGFEFITRRGDALRLAGFLVEPREIESFIETLEGVEAAQVVEVDGRPVAFVIGDADPDAIVERCRAELAGFKAPRTIIGLDAFPTTPSANGERVQRAELRRRAQEHVSAG
jgi:fatty-acyl-CoA synthase